MAYCNNCGSETLEGAAFCTNCGIKLSPVPKITPQQVVTRHADGTGNQPVIQQVTVFQQEKKSKTPYVLIGILVGLVIALAVTVGLYVTDLTSSKKDPNLGRYEAVSYETQGVLHAPEGEWIELQAGGKAVLFWEGEEYNCKWQLKDNALTVTQAGVDFKGTLQNGLMTLQIHEMGFTFSKDGAVAPIQVNAADVQGGMDESWWSGDWYGWWVVSRGKGQWKELEDNYWAVCATIELSDDDTGNIWLWDSDCEDGDGIASVNFTLTEGLTDKGALRSDSGSFYECDVGSGDWVIDPGSHEWTGSIQDMICISGEYVDPENSKDSFSYLIFLRPWGMEWDDVRDADTTDCAYDDMMPDLYDGWYLPLIRSGVTEAPEKIG